MKKYYGFIFIMCILLSTGCSSNRSMIERSSTSDDNSSTNTDKTGIVEASIDKTQTTNAGDKYRIYTEVPSSPMEFDKEISNNQIDKSYEEDLDQAVTTEDIINVQTKYIGQWKEEMQNAVDSLKSISSETDYNSFKVAQDEWEKQMLDNSEADKEIIANSQYNIMLGSEYGWMYLSNIREQYRDRAFHIKYMIYLIETKGYV